MANKKSRQKKSKKNVRNHGKNSSQRLTFVPIQRVRRHLIEHNFASRISRDTPIALIAVLEYLTTEMLSLAAKMAIKSQTNRITPRHIQLAVRLDKEFNQLLQWTTIADGGVVPTVK